MEIQSWLSLGDAMDCWLKTTCLRDARVGRRATRVGCVVAR